MGKRRKKRYIEYDPEELCRDSASLWEEYLIEQSLRLGERKWEYATKETYAGDQLIIKLYPEFTRAEAEKFGVKRKSGAAQKAAQNRLNTKKSREEFWALAEHNFTNQDFWLTLTYSEQPTLEEANKCFERFKNNINGKRKRRGFPNAKYLVVTESVTEDGEPVRVHHHLFISGDCLDLDELNRMWKYGKRNELRKIEKDENGIAGASKYMTKVKKDTNRKKYQKRWKGSKNLQKPPEKKHHQNRIGKVRKMATSQEYIRNFITKDKRYAGYIYNSSEVYFNDCNGFVYITIRARKEKRGERKDE